MREACRKSILLTARWDLDSKQHKLICAWHFFGMASVKKKQFTTSFEHQIHKGISHEF
jgi:hypothetical protein